MKSKLALAAAASVFTLSLTTVALADDAAAPATANPATPATPVSTTTTTAASDDPVALAPAPATASAAPKAEGTTLYQKRTPNRFFLYVGGAALAGTYATTAVIAANNGSIGDHDLYLPVVGPWINLASRDSSTTSTGDTILIVGSGVLQGVGAGMVIASLFIPEKYATATIAAGPVKMNVSPTAGAGSGGVGAFGTF
jgi:hypothetical protein